MGRRLFARFVVFAATFAVLYVAATLLGVPATPLVIVAALLFGPVPAFLAMAAGSTLSAVLAFLLARSTARAALGERFQRTTAYARLCRLVERYDALVIPVVRLAPVLPFAAVNYGMGLTRIPFWRYALWSAAAIAIGDGLLVFGTDAIYDALTGARVRWPVFAGVGLALAAALALVAVGRRRSLPGRTYRTAAARCRETGSEPSASSPEPVTLLRGRASIWPSGLRDGHPPAAAAPDGGRSRR